MSHTETVTQILSTHSVKLLSDAILYYELIEEFHYSKRISYAIFTRLSYENGNHKECLVRDITSDKALAMVLYHKIICGLVTPTTVTEILSDLLAEY